MPIRRWLEQTINPKASVRPASIAEERLAYDRGTQLQSPFFSILPAEIRLLIYQHVLGGRKLHIVVRQQGPLARRRNRLTHFEFPEEVTRNPNGASIILTKKEYERQNLVTLLTTCRQMFVSFFL
jgi:hypothetical protein